MNYMIIENRLDYDTYISLREKAGWQNFSKEQTEKALSNSFYSVTVQDAGQNIGMGRVIGDGLYFTIVDVVVAPEFQGKGLGTLIIQRILKYIEDGMYPDSRVSIQLIAEIGKEDFYIKQGFKLIPHDFCGPALRKIIKK